MDLSLALMSNIAVMLIWVLVGYLAVKLSVLKTEDSRLLSSLTIYIFCPCMILMAFQIDLTPERLHGFLYAMAFVFVIYIVWIVITQLIKKPLSLDPVDTTSLVYSNVGNLVIPLVSMMDPRKLHPAGTGRCQLGKASEKHQSHRRIPWPDTPGPSGPDPGNHEKDSQRSVSLCGTVFHDVCRSCPCRHFREEYFHLQKGIRDTAGSSHRLPAHCPWDPLVQRSSEPSPGADRHPPDLIHVPGSAHRFQCRTDGGNL